MTVISIVKWNELWGLSRRLQVYYGEKSIFDAKPRFYYSIYEGTSHIIWWKKNKTIYILIRASGNLTIVISFISFHHYYVGDGGIQS